MRDDNCAPVRPATRLGDIWSLGPHRLVCGDATDPAIVALSLAGASPHLMVTDPPYGVGCDPAWRVRQIQERRGSSSVGAIGRVNNDHRADWREAFKLFEGDVAYVWHASLHASEAEASLRAVGFEVRSQIVWDKCRLIISRGHYHWRHEPCLYAVRKGKTGHWHGDRPQQTVWPIKHRKPDTGHAAQKPLEAMRRPIENSSGRGDGVYDPFLGSGTTLIAAEETGRICYAIELNHAYCDIAVRRWEAMTGQKAERIMT